MANVAITALPTVSTPGANDYLIIQGSKTQKIAWKNLLNTIYPVGSLYMSAKATSPASLFGGTWERIKDRFILAAGDTYAAGTSGGEANHTLSISEMPEHNHRMYSNYNAASHGSDKHVFDYTSGAFKAQSLYTPIDNITEYTGKSQPHNNMPPYLTAYTWRRIA